ncbi:MAG: helix-hairpin-helix domain-containing protein [Niabella sp.]
MNIKHLLNAYLTFSKREGLAIIILLIIIVALAALPFMRRSNPAAQNISDSSFIALAETVPEPQKFNDGQKQNYAELQYQYSRKSYNSSPARLFPFDPNTLGAEGFKELGLRDKTIQTLMNYRNKGGQFRKPDDLKKIYGLRPDEYTRLAPYISIAAKENNHPEYQKKEWEQRSPAAEKNYYTKKQIDINEADTTAFKSLYGIGSARAMRIVNFREKLGGFYTIEQVGETYGIPDSIFQKIKPLLTMSSSSVKKININTAGYEELNAHPYINSKLAFQIMKYRKEKSSFADVDNVKELADAAGDNFDKLKHYITLDNP